MNIRRTATAFAVVAALCFGAQAFAHEMFLRAEKSIVPSSSDQVVRLMNGTFDESENSITRDRMQNVSILANGAVTNPPEGAWYD